ncbi:hypothetical protein BGW38_001918 [Lunasporangiospora selenospora]|uniref:Uncharacterized protein n=1 Tax=Lunasporangiospora selenospora TaxID=979761 RepID=A0A9P6KDW3_9FUNG|nr:hypothetical protein BGW38_001918 [Lunasporangiospora selenospora]
MDQSTTTTKPKATATSRAATTTPRSATTSSARPKNPETSSLSNSSSASSSSLSPSPTVSAGASTSSGLSTPAIAGIAAAGGLILFFILSVILCKRRRRRIYENRPDASNDRSRDPINPNDVLPPENKYNQRTPPLPDGDSGFISYPLALRSGGAGGEDKFDDIALHADPRTEQTRQTLEQQYQHYDEQTQSRFVPENPIRTNPAATASAPPLFDPVAVDNQGHPLHVAPSPTAAITVNPAVAPSAASEADTPLSPSQRAQRHRQQRQQPQQQPLQPEQTQSPSQHPVQHMAEKENPMIINDMGNEFVIQTGSSNHSSPHHRPLDHRPRNSSEEGSVAQSELSYLRPSGQPTSPRGPGPRNYSPSQPLSHASPSVYSTGSNTSSQQPLNIRTGSGTPHVYPESVLSDDGARYSPSTGPRRSASRPNLGSGPAPNPGSPYQSPRQGPSYPAQSTPLHGPSSYPAQNSPRQGPTFPAQNSPRQGPSRPAQNSPSQYPQNDGYSQNGYSQNGYSQNGYSQNGYPQNGGYPQNNHSQSNYSQGGYSQQQYPQQSNQGYGSPSMYPQQNSPHYQGGQGSVRSPPMSPTTPVGRSPGFQPSPNHRPRNNNYP